MAFETIHATRHAGGVTLEWAEHGDPSGEPLILLHGVSDSLISWRPFAAALPPSIRAIAITQRGHGGSQKPQAGYGSADFTSDIICFMEAIGLRRAHIAGHSMGGWIALRLAQSDPDRIASLTLIGAVQSLIGNPAGLEVADAVAAMGDVIDPAFVREFQESTMAIVPSEALLAQAVAESLRMPAHVWRAVFAAILAEPPAQPDRAIPTLLLNGERDAFIGAAERAMLEQDFHAPQTITYGDLGHAPHWEKPARVAADVARFISSQRTAKGRAA